MAKDKERPVMKTAQQVISALRLRYPDQGYAFLQEVRNSTGYGRTPRYADALIMSLWPSRGLEVIGVEVKVSRSDWKHELEQFAKADEIFKYCDRWFLAVGDESIVEAGELPPTWGLLVPKTDKELKLSTEAPALNPTEMGRSFVAAVLRRVAAQCTEEAKLKEAEHKGYTEGLTAGKSQSTYDIDRWKRLYEHLLKDVTEFESQSGVTIKNGWHTDKIGEAVRMVMNGAYLRERDRLTDLLGRAKRCAEFIQGELRESEASNVLLGRDPVETQSEGEGA